MRHERLAFPPRRLDLIVQLAIRLRRLRLHLFRRREAFADALSPVVEHLYQRSPCDEPQHDEQDREVHQLRDQDRQVNPERTDSEDDHRLRLLRRFVFFGEIQS